MPQPTIADVAIGDNKFRALGVHFGMATLHDGVTGMPMKGTLSCSIAVVVDINDQGNMPFATLSNIFQLAQAVTTDKIQKIVLTFWADDARKDVICTYTFQGWISNYVTATGSSRGGDGDAKNHILTLTLQPEVDNKQYTKITIGN